MCVVACEYVCMHMLRDEDSGGVLPPILPTVLVGWGRQTDSLTDLELPK